MRGNQLLGLVGLCQRENRPQVHRKLPGFCQAAGWYTRRSTSGKVRFDPPCRSMNSTAAW